MPCADRLWRCMAVLVMLAGGLAALCAAPRDTLQVVRIHTQLHFPLTVPAGNYSGITYLGGREYAVVDDKSKTDGFHLFTIDIDSVSGQIISVVNHGFCSSGLPNRDGEGIVYVPSAETILISGEADGRIIEYSKEGVCTGREAQIPAVYKHAAANLGFEALGYSDATRCLWTCNEAALDGDGPRADGQQSVCMRLRVQSFDSSLKPLRQYAYQTEKPIATGHPSLYAMGVAAMTALNDGSLLMLEREFYVSSIRLGSFVNCRLYQAWPEHPIAQDSDITASDVPLMDKHLLAEWRTTLGLLSRSIANYEGMCLGPTLADGSRVLVLVSDSQAQYGGVLRDWFKTIVVR